MIVQDSSPVLEYFPFGKIMMLPPITLFDKYKQCTISQAPKPNSQSET